jgi:hypothetical protein
MKMLASFVNMCILAACNECTDTEMDRHFMKQLKGSRLEDRQKAAAEAKLEMLNKFKAAPKPDDPEMVAKRAEREALSVAREERRAEREKLKKEKAAQLKAETAERKALEAKTREADLKKKAAKSAETEAERKAERDRRYAARKARKR